MTSHDEHEPDDAPSADTRFLYLVPAEPPRQEAGTEDIWSLLIALWAGRRAIALVTLVFALVGVAYALLATSWYRAEVVLVPAKDVSAQGLPAQLAELAGVAGLAGLALGQQDKVEPLAVLKSRSFARTFIEGEGIEGALLDQRGRSFVSKLLNSGKPADVRDAVEFFDEELRTVVEDRRAGLVTVSVEWTDPAVAARWANSIVRRLNERLRSRALADAQRNVDYLQKTIGSTGLVSLQQSIGRLLEAELQKLMVARGTEEFAFRVVDEASAPKKRTWPKRTAIVVASALLGMFVGALFVVARRRLPVRR